MTQMYYLYNSDDRKSTECLTGNQSVIRAACFVEVPASRVCPRSLAWSPCPPSKPALAGHVFLIPITLTDSSVSLFHIRGACDYTEPIQLVQEKVPRLEISVSPATFISPCRVT